MNQFDNVFEQFKVHGKDLAAKIRELIHEGNVRRIIVKDENGHTFMEIPLTVAAIGVIAAPVIAAVAAIAGLVANFTLIVERNAHSATAPKPESPSSTDSSVGATDDQVDMAGTVSQEVNDAAGTGKPDAQGG
jgi:Domain of unknown function (DUF4342)